jgi:hypothetical protein
LAFGGGHQRGGLKIQARTDAAGDASL